MGGHVLSCGKRHRLCIAEDVPAPLASSGRRRAPVNSPADRKEKCMDRNSYLRGMTRRSFAVSLGPGMYVLGMAVANGAPLKKVPTATGIDALYVPFVVAAELKIFEKHGLETSYKPLDRKSVV